MSLSALSSDEIAIVGQCLRAAAFGPFFPDWEFSALFGVTRAEAQAVAERFPHVDEHDDENRGCDDTWLVINNTFVNLLGYPHGQDLAWSQYISATPAHVRRVYDRWRAT